MKNLIFVLIAGVLLSCNTSEKSADTASQPAASTVQMPYTAAYSSNIDQSVSDQDVQTVLNSYKAWENGDMAALRATLSDSIAFNAWDGFAYNGPADGLMKRWSASRDSLSAVKITPHVWTRSHFIDKKIDVITVWYSEIDTYKNGKIDSAYWSDINMVENGKIKWYSQYKQATKK